MIKLNQSNHPIWVLSHCLNYVFGRIDKYELKRLCGEEYLLANQLVKSGYFLKNCKLYFYWLLKHNSANYLDFKVHKQDAKLLNKCKRYFTQLNTSWPALSLKDFNSYINEVFSQKMSVYMGKFISKKLYFLVKSYGLSYHDIKLDMAAASMMAMYKAYPYFESKLHAINIAKCAIHNAGMGIISYYTKDCRSQLIKEKDGTFQHKLRNIDTISHLSAPDCFAHIDNNLELVSNVLDSSGQKFMRLAIGHYDHEFSTYLGRDNTDYLDSARYGTYLKKIRSYLNLSQAQVQSYLSTIKNHTVM